ncbi:MAG: OB-fold domain-containing protein [Chloroflexota bacterium]
MTTQQYTKPIPMPDADTRPFWGACKKHELQIQRCTDCSSYCWTPMPICYKCNSWNFEWAKMSGKGTVYSWIVVQQTTIPSFEVPYVPVLISLAEQSDCRMLSNMVECDPHAIYNNMPVEVVFEDITPEISLPKWRPALERDRLKKAPAAAASKRRS